MKKTTSVLLSSFTAIALSASLIAGSTFALFTSESKIDIAVTSGKVDVTAAIEQDSLKVYTLDQNTDKKEEATGTEGTATFPVTGGKATLATKDGDPDLKIDNFVPGNSVEFNITVENRSSIAVKYQFGTAFEGDKELFSGLDIQLKEGDDALELVSNELLYTRLSKWRTYTPTADGETITLHVVIDFPIDFDDNTAQGKACSFNFTVSAVQANAATADPEPVTVDSASVALSTETELKALGDMVAMGESFEGKTVELSGDVTITDNWEPIGTSDHPFEADFNGNGHTITVDSTYDISELKNDGTSIKLGLFGYVNNTEITGIHTEGTFKLTGEITKYINLNIAGIYADSAYADQTYISRCTNSIDIDLSAVTIASEVNSFQIQIGGICAQRSRLGVSDCLNEGDIILPTEALKSTSAKYYIVVGGISAMGQATGGGGNPTFTNVLNVGKMPESIIPETPDPEGNNAVLMAGGIFGLDLRAEASLAPIATTWFSLDSPVVGCCIGEDGLTIAVYKGNKLTAETVKVQGTYTGFDFDKVWTMGDTHPVLQ